MATAIELNQKAIELKQHSLWARMYYGCYIQSKSREKFVIITKQGDDYLATYNGETKTMEGTDCEDEFYIEFVYDFDEQSMLCRCIEKLGLCVYFDGDKKTGWIQTVNDSIINGDYKYNSFEVKVEVKFVDTP